MKNLIDYKKGGNTGAIFTNEYSGEITFVAVTASASKDYKSLKAAEKFLMKMGYEKC